ncbi:hypothetical protein [Clostridium saccharobutylicum]|uniref:Uncharacterized protein n=1 Tax=Clostridium saccharobutylicum DSM 13864 TaxID=1345695 RepID=U5MLK2_CLOSA|nr:hypothetical protein [Clostridium saccharobutylicum]AGX41465.1 hypothetical protein CLSA_c04340 [Clostridium saccharobutylicum DSM 13864]AQR88746.1 hypothetical protein CLOSC_04230 [Clostridium saccharobutylicum]AQR98644.1 hypothetical protein CSACC_04290 [Clostridium saccharobutylicum]AQS12634.1 hypothetical protein CLOSACC_04290 [Clostridium saccharobutylicum]MBA2905654.1 hypothetical protein [Clostridium saccharobutylicum]
MHKEGIESWRIVVSSDISLNFILFTGCLYGLIDVDNIKGRNRLWPSKHFNDKLTKQLPLLKNQWSEWFNTIVKDRGEKVILKQKFDYKYNMFNLPNFSDFQYYELRECCKNAWKPFIEWWEMIGGGRNALSYFEGFGDEKIYQYIGEFENKVQRKVKPFNLYIDLVYTGTSQIIEANSEYIVMIPVRPIYFDKDWWMNKLQQVG